MRVLHYTWNDIQLWKLALSWLDDSKKGCITNMLPAKMYFYFPTLLLLLPQRTTINT